MHFVLAPGRFELQLQRRSVPPRVAAMPKVSPDHSCARETADITHAFASHTYHWETLSGRADSMNPLDLPAFIWVVFTLYWILPISMLLGYLRPWQLRGKRNDGADWWVVTRKIGGHACTCTWAGAQPAPAMRLPCFSSSAQHRRWGACRATCLMDMCRMRAYKLGSGDLYRGGPCMYLVRRPSCRMSRRHGGARRAAAGVPSGHAW